MDCKKSDDGTKLTVTLSGEVDASNVGDIEEKLLEEIEGVTELTFDLRDLEYISSAGLRVLLQMQKTMKTQGNMMIANTNDEVMDIFKVTGFVRLLNLV